MSWLEILQNARVARNKLAAAKPLKLFVSARLSSESPEDSPPPSLSLSLSLFLHKVRPV